MQSKRHKSRNFVNMNKMKCRDDRMYNTSEWYRNCINEKNSDTMNKIKYSIKAMKM